MNFLSLGAIIESVGKVADDLFTSDEERMKIQLQGMKIEADLLHGQQETNTAEAKHQSIFVAGWRPFIGWVGGIALAFHFLLYPILSWSILILRSKGLVDLDPNNLPKIDAGPLFALVTSMLGIGGMRSFEKFKKVDSKTVRKR